jgi:histidinol-phosphate aminotransferase
MPDSSALLSVFRPEVRALSAYHVADATGMVKLDAMENPYQWPETIKREWLETLMDCAINRYPDPEARQLAEKIREINGIAPDSAILLGNGSDEIIQIILMALTPDATVLSVSPSFVMYRQISLTLGLNYVEVPLSTSDFNLDLSAFLDAMAKHQPAIVFLAYPNNPTGNLFDADNIRHILKKAPGLVVIDEAYAPFADASFMDELGDFDNLLVMRTVSKLGLAGLRLGYLAGKPEIVEQLHKVRLPYNINILTQGSTYFALCHHSIFDEQTATLRQERGGLLERLNRIDGIDALPSAANFILFKTTQTDATAIFNQLKARKILIKNLSPQGGSLTNCLRVTVGTPEENRLFLEALHQIMAA